MSYCGDTCAVNTEGDAQVAVSLPCKTWTCPDCFPVRRAQLVSECHRGEPNTFLTLTLKRIPGRTPVEAAKTLSRAWRLLRLRILRDKNMRKLPFAAVFEAHQSGYPHLHILLRSIWIDVRWLSAQMQDICDSPVVYIKRIDNRSKLAGYVAKYCGKAAHRFGTCKRYWFSKDWHVVDRKPFKPIFQVTGRWTIEQLPIAQWIAFRQWEGKSVERIGLRHARCRK